MIRSLCNSTGEIYDHCLRSIVGDATGRTLIDLCAGRALHSQTVGFKQHTLVDVNSFSERAGNSEFIQADVLGPHPVFNQHYDVSLCSDGIEHFSYADADKLLRRMIAISDMQIIFTPIGPYLLFPESNTDPNTHKSFWYPKHFSGWAVLEMPVYHPLLHLGAFWAWRHRTRIETKASFERVYHRLRGLNLVEPLPLLETASFPV